MSQIGHLYENWISVQRERDGAWFHFQTYRLNATEWGYELVRAEGHSCSTVSDPNYSSESAAIAAIREHVEDFQRIPGYGWCVVPKDDNAAVGMRR